MIKAIQTEYKGYRFRSRLEARWAVFFDALGIDWEYEPEGYDLGDLGWYLPDFYLPDSKTWVEVKPPFPTGATSVYLAGKIRKNCWRHSIAPMRGAEHDFNHPHYWESVKSHLNPLVEVTGPFFMSCDHGCSHGPNTHGQGEDGCGESYGLRRDWASHVVRECKSSINKSRDMFVWIDELDCYGTLIECGFAKAKGVDIRVAVSSKLKDIVGDEQGNDLWFLETMSEDFGFFDSAKDAFMTYYPLSGFYNEYIKVEKLALSKGEHSIIVGGDPLNHNYYGNTPAINAIYSDKNYSIAAQKARSARFEHGEKP